MMSLLRQRCSGVLLHPTSLPGAGAQGRIGHHALSFVDFLGNAGFSVWQTLPLNPRDGTGSPYQASSVFALDPDLLDPEALIETEFPEDLLKDKESATPRELAAVLLRRIGGPDYQHLRQAFADFVREQRYWLEDYALYQALRSEQAAPWYDWPAPLRDRDPEALDAARSRHGDQLERIRMTQFLLDRQWSRLRGYAHGRGVYLFGDLAFFVAHDSADVWAHRELFQLDNTGALTANTGVPPDYFSATGQLWNMPHYDWSTLQATGWHWWIERLRRQFELFDLLRLDHFRGFAGAWHVPAGSADATRGEWRSGPGLALFHAVHDALGPLPLIAEDLGRITADVDELRRTLAVPGMRVLQFAFNSDAANPHLPHNYERDTVAYTGTHDNNTLAGWWQEDCDAGSRGRAAAYLGRPREAPEAALQRLVLASVARLAVLPMQDLLELGSHARMNTPGTQTGNWSWRLTALPDDARTAHLRELNALYGRFAEEQ